MWIHPNEAISDIVRAAEHLEREGVHQLWIGDEGVSRDPFVLLAACAMGTRNIELGLGVTNPVLRHPGVVAAAAATLAELSGDRFILGWGSGGSESLGPFGLKSSSPVESIRAAVRTTRDVLSGERSDTYQPPIHASPSRHVRQYIGARGSKLNVLASEIADGVFLSGIDASDLDRIVSIARSVRNIEVALYQTVHSAEREVAGTVSGTPHNVAQHLSELIERLRPHSIGIACVDDWDLQHKVDFSLEVFRHLEQDS
jgi:5,10-methylenetetrahydromethanopterin reductase